MLVSVIIPTYNRIATLPRALNSVLQQEGVGKDFELDIIVVDDGSSDGTGDLLCREFPHLKYLHQPNQGVSKARNVGLQIANGEWIALLDSDDEWMPHKLYTQLEILAKTGLQVCHTEERWVRNGARVNQMNKHRKQGGWVFQHCLPLCAMSPSSILIHRDVITAVGEFDESLPACEDYDYWLRLSARYEVAFIEEECIIKYGGHDDQLSRQHWGMDRFRVYALQKILDSQNSGLSSSDTIAARAMLEKKLQILLAGASKRGNTELVDQCEQQLSGLSQADYA